MMRLTGWSCLALLMGVSLVQAEENTLSTAEKMSGWELLFDGKTTDGWRNYKKETISPNWVVEEGAMVRKPGGGDIISKREFESFELSLEYKISKGGNSGLMFHVTEVAGTPWQTGPEIQIQDNVDGHDPQKAGWLYQLYQPPTDPATGEITDATRPAGEWNQIYIKITPEGSEIDMNGVRYARFKKGSADWDERVAKSKFSKFEHFGKPTKGHISLQDHGNEVAFRNIKVRDLTEEIPQPIHGTLPVKVVHAFPNLKWEGYEPVDERGRPQTFRPIYITHADGDADHLYLAEQHGVIYRFENKADVTTSKVFLDIRDRVNYSDRQNEEGFLGLAFHPDYADNHKFYVYYIKKPGQISIVSEFTAKDNVADVGSERVLMQLEQPFWNHNGGTLVFGPDGYLYIALGDGGAGNDPYGNAQNLNTLLGSILRIDVNSKAEGKAYGIPADNPFVGQENAQPEIYAYGFRNIWRMSFDRETGTFWAADVGQNLWEEIDIVTSGGNYGWNRKEGTHPFGDKAAGDSVIAPIWEYDHEIGKSITGGFVYRGSQVPSLKGKYVYADYVSGQIWALTYNADGGEVKNEAIESDKLPVITFGEDSAGEVYFGVVTPDGRGVYRFAEE